MTPPTAATTPVSPSHSELSAASSLPLDSLPNDSFHALKNRPRDTAKHAKSHNDATSQHTASATATTRLRPRAENPDYYEARPRTSKPSNRQPKPPNTASPQQQRCCPPEIPLAFLEILDRLDARAVRRMLSVYAPLKLPFQNMYLAHLQGFTKALTSEELSGDLRSLSPDTASEPTSFDHGPYLRRRRTSLPDLADSTPLKRFWLGDVTYGSVSPTPGQECRSGHDPARDEEYRQQVLVRLRTMEHAPDSWGRRTDKLIFNIL